MSQLIAIRLLDAEEPSQPLLKAVQDLANGQPNQATYQVDSASFRQVPNTPFAYWVSESIRKLFKELPPFEGEGRTARQGLATADDFRFVRTAWETPVRDVSKIWLNFAKGGSYSPFYSDVHLKLNWGKNGEEIKSWAGSLYNNSHWSRIIKSTDFYFRPGLTWLRRTKLFCPKVLPSGVIFSDGGQAAFNPGKELETVAVLYSSISQTFISLSLGTTSQEQGGTNPQFMPGMVSKIPFNLTKSFEIKVKPLAKSAWSLKRNTDTNNLTSHAFYAPALSTCQFYSRSSGSNSSQVPS